MYQLFTFYHNFMRWLVLASLILAIYKAYKIYFFKSISIKIDDAVIHWTVAIAYIQLILGIILYFQSHPIYSCVLAVIMLISLLVVYVGYRSYRL